MTSLTPHEIQSHIVCVRRGPGANCSSIGSAVEMLFLSATLGAAVLAAITAAMSPAPPPDDDPSPTDETTSNDND